MIMATGSMKKAGENSVLNLMKILKNPKYHMNLNLEREIL